MSIIDDEIRREMICKIYTTNLQTNSHDCPHIGKNSPYNVGKVSKIDQGKFRKYLESRGKVRGLENKWPQQFSRNLLSLLVREERIRKCIFFVSQLWMMHV